MSAINRILMLLRSAGSAYLALCVFVLANSVGGFAPAASFQGLGFIPPSDGGTASIANDISADGSVVLGISDGQDFRWTRDTGIIPIGPPPGPANGRAIAISPDGETIAGYLNSFDQVPLIWTDGAGYLPLGNPTGYLNGAAMDVSQSGATVVGWSDNHTSDSGEAWRWTSSAGFQLLGFLPGAVGSTATAVSADGNIIAGRGHVDGENGLQALMWVADSGPVGLGYLPFGNVSYSQAISSDGTAIVGTGLNIFGWEQAFLWTAETKLLPLGFAGLRSQAFAVSNGGQFVVGRAQVLPLGGAFIWDANNGMRSLQSVLVNEYGLGPSLTGWTLDAAMGISDNGQVIIGNGIDPDGHMQGWIVELPEPNGFLLALPGVAIAAFLILRQPRSHATCRTFLVARRLEVQRDAGGLVQARDLFVA